MMRILMAGIFTIHSCLAVGEANVRNSARLAKKHEIHVLTRRFKGLPSYEKTGRIFRR